MLKLNFQKREAKPWERLFFLILGFLGSASLGFGIFGPALISAPSTISVIAGIAVVIMTIYVMFVLAMNIVDAFDKYNSKK